MYENNNVKAIAFGESHLRQTTGVARRLRGDLEDKLTNGIPSLRNVGRFKRHRGMTPDERRKAIIDELKAEVEDAEFEVLLLTRLVDDLKALVDNPEPENGMWVWECKNTRRAIAEATGDNPLSYVEDE